MTAPDLDRCYVLAAAFPYRDYHDDLANDIAEYVLRGWNYEDAQRRLFNQYEYAVRVERGIASLDELQAVWHDELNVRPLDAPTLSRRQRTDYKDGEKATPRVPEQGVSNEDREDIAFLWTVLCNWVDRGLLPSRTMARTLLFDVRQLPDNFRGAVTAVLCSAPVRELRGMGYSAARIREAREYLERYAGARYDQIVHDAL